MTLSQFLKTWRVQGTSLVAELFGGLTLNGPTTINGALALGTGGEITQPLVALVYGPAITPDASAGNVQVVTATNNVAFTINAPTNPPAAGSTQFLTLTIRNASGGALGVATFNAAFKLAAWTQPANGFSRSITFRWDGANWVEVNRTTVDVPN